MTIAYAPTWKNSTVLWTQAINSYPNHFYAYGTRASALQKAGDKAAAIADLDRCLELNPRFAQAWNNRGHLHQQLGNADQALTDISTALRLNPSLTEGHINIGVILLTQGRLEEAEQAFSTAIELDDSNGLAYLNRGIVRGRLNNQQAALLDFGEGLNRVPNFAPGYRERARLLEYMGYHDLAPRL